MKGVHLSKILCTCWNSLYNLLDPWEGMDGPTVITIQLRIVGDQSDSRTDIFGHKESRRAPLRGFGLRFNDLGLDKILYNLFRHCQKTERHDTEHKDLSNGFSFPVHSLVIYLISLQIQKGNCSQSMR